MTRSRCRRRCAPALCFECESSSSDAAHYPWALVGAWRLDKRTRFCSAVRRVIERVKLARLRTAPPANELESATDDLLLEVVQGPSAYLGGGVRVERSSSCSLPLGKVDGKAGASLTKADVHKLPVCEYDYIGDLHVAHDPTEPSRIVPPHVGARGLSFHKWIGEEVGMNR
jgi:hypothetical protein